MHRQRGQRLGRQTGAAESTLVCNRRAKRRLVGARSFSEREYRLPIEKGLQVGADQPRRLLRAIVMENISVRAEGPTLELPAGPSYRLHKEIKNVITVIAKTNHYWEEHIAGGVPA